MKRPKNSNLAATAILMDMSNLIKAVNEGHDRYLIAKLIDFFIELPARYQAAFIDYFCEAIPNERWTKSQGDDTLYLTALRAIALHFTGLEKMNQPTLEDFYKHVADFMKSDHFKKANVVVRKTAFSETLKEL